MKTSPKIIEAVFSPPAPHMVGDGFRVHNFFPMGTSIDISRMSPFLLLDYNSKIEFSPRENPRGVGVHPHRGFETVTIAYAGKVAHYDSTGNSGVIGEGDVQWMTAGSGILHKEYHEQEFSRKGGPFQMIQLWVNLPSKYKMTTPGYQSLENKNINKYQLPDGKGVIEIIAGEYLPHATSPPPPSLPTPSQPPPPPPSLPQKGEGVGEGENKIFGSASTFSLLNLFNMKVNAGGEAEFNFDPKHNTGILVVEGKVTVNDSAPISADHFILFKHEGDGITVKAMKDSILLILDGEPINEPIYSHGPFVMNTKEEILQAFDDLNSGKFGYLE